MESPTLYAAAPQIQKHLKCRATSTAQIPEMQSQKQRRLLHEGKRQKTQTVQRNKINLLEKETAQKA
jgi:hypothetical protein